jgi:hypothetical protein
MARGHFAANVIAKKIIDASYWWPTLFKDTNEFAEVMIAIRELGTKWKWFGQISNLSKRTFYEVGSKFYKSN